MGSLVQIEGVARNYRTGDNVVHALRPTHLSFEAGEFIMILGPSGSGKTTLLNLIAGIDSPSEGKLLVDGKDIANLDRAGLVEYRQRYVGVVFQFFNLVPNLTAKENVQLVAELAGGGSPVEALKSVGLGARLDHFPHELSGGEQQRVAIARALVKDPPLILGDEATGNLDAATGKKILKLFQEIHRSGRCVVLATHNTALTQIATRVLTLADGEVRSDTRNPNPADPNEVDW